MGLSFEQPVETIDSIVNATVNLLDVIRFLGEPIRFCNAGSSECFGDAQAAVENASTPFWLRSPYAEAKAAAYWMVVNYRVVYALFACNGILFNNESALRPARFVTRLIHRSSTCGHG